jgi:pimeloyl-ACP methyl ester carboxylesterase
LPPSYAKHRARRYPVIYALPGLGGTDTSFYGRPVDLEALEKESGREAIIVSVDTSTRSGSTYLTDSPTEGDFDTFLAAEVPAAIDKAYRTLARGKGRALIGQSTGGFNAVSFGLRHSQAFGAIAAMSPDGLDLGAWLSPDGKVLAAPWLHLARLEDGMKSAGEMTSLAASFSPDPSSARGFDWPCDLSTGALDAAVWSKWLAFSPSVLLTQPKILEEAKANLNGRMSVTVAEDDEFDLFGPAKRFVDQAMASGVKVVFTPTKGGHTDGIVEREQSSVRFLLETLDAAKP